MLRSDSVSPLCRPQQCGPGESGQYYSGPVPQRLCVQQGGRAHLLHHHPGESSSCPDSRMLKLCGLSLGWARRGFVPDPSASVPLLLLAPCSGSIQPSSRRAQPVSCSFPTSLGSRRRVSAWSCIPQVPASPHTPLIPPFHPSIPLLWARRQRANKSARACSGGAC